MTPRKKEDIEKIREISRNKIMDSALKLFAKHGFDKTSIRMIAKDAGVSVGLLYNYFKSKDEVLKTLFIDIFAEYLPVLKYSKKESDPFKRFKLTVDASMKLLENNRDKMKLYFSLMLNEEMFKKGFDEFSSSMELIMQEFLLIFQEMKFENPYMSLRIYSAALDGLQMHYLVDPEGFPYQEAYDYLMNEIYNKYQENLKRVGDKK